MANLCVFHMYGEHQICELFKAELADSERSRANDQYPFNGYVTHMPWIYYDQGALDVL